MAKAAYSSKDVQKASFGIQEGNVEVVGAISTVHQYPPNGKTGKQSDPFGCVQLEFHLLDKEFNRKEGEETVKAEFGWGSMEKFHPGKATGADDDDPEDMGDELDVEGNCIYSDGSRISTNTSWARLTASMELVGFKPEVLGNGFLPDLIGTKGHVKTDKLEKWAGYKGDNDPTQLVFDKIVAFPYEGKQKGKTAPAKPGTKPSSTSSAKPGSAAASSAGNGANDADSIAGEIIAELMTEMAGKELDPKAIKSKATAKLMRRKVPVPQHKGVFTILTSAEFLEKKGEELGFAWDADEEKVIFPEA